MAGAAVLIAAAVLTRPSSVYNALTSVSADSANDAWAAGSYINDTTGVRDTLILHWNGTAWSARYARTRAL